jgi:hypothetical protein
MSKQLHHMLDPTEVSGEELRAEARRLRRGARTAAEDAAADAYRRIRQSREAIALADKALARRF